jgi:ATP-dependent RNA helicase RhlE
MEQQLMSFSSLGLCNALLKSLEQQGYTSPSAIQSKAIPAVLSLRDVMAIANTGTGKTAGFALPILQLLSAKKSANHQHLRALVITPTRELASQVAQSIQTYAQCMDVVCGAVFGGVRIEPQKFMLQTGVDILIATPGRLLDLHQQGAINFKHLEILVLDEADHMLDLGFIDDISRIQKLLPSERQTLMFSATFSKQIKALAKGMLNNPVLLEVSSTNSSIDKIKQQLYWVDKERKSELLIHLIKQNNWQPALIFVRTKRGADSLVNQLESEGIVADSIHANRTQRARTLALEGFKNGRIKVLIATDIAARGIDISQLPYVINFDLPYVPQDYVHRIGRTGRAGSSGLAISLFSEDESAQLLSIERLIGRTFKRDIIIGFTPHKKAPDTRLPKDKDAEYGNFEADPKQQQKKRGSRQAKRRTNRSR